VRRPIDINTAPAAVGCVVMLMFLAGAVTIMFLSTTVTSRFVERVVFDDVFGPGSYEKGLRFVGKGPHLTNGRELASGWMCFITACVAAVFFVTSTIYVFIFNAFTGFPISADEERPQKWEKWLSKRRKIE
jgi:hypothetical protein